MIELFVCVTFLIVGIAIGYTIQPKEPAQGPDELSKKVDKLEKEIIIYKNLKESLLNDISYWRNKAGGK